MMYLDRTNCRSMKDKGVWSDVQKVGGKRFDLVGQPRYDEGAQEWYWNDSDGNEWFATGDVVVWNETSEITDGMSVKLD